MSVFQEKLEGLKLVARDFHTVGLTGVIEMVGGGVTDNDYAVLFELWRRKELTMRTALNIYTGSLAHAQRWMQHLPMRFGDDWLKINGLGEQLHAGAQDNLSTTFAFRPEALEEYRRIVTEAARNRWSIQQHTTLGTTATTFLDIYEEVNRRYPIKDLRWALAHVETISDADLQRIKRLGMGVTVVAHYNPFITLWWMVTGKNWAGTVVRPSQRVSRKEALRLHTLGSAWFSFDEHLRGSIEPGKLADLVVLTADYLSVPEDKIREIKAALTIVGGKIVYEAAP